MIRINFSKKHKIVALTLFASMICAFIYASMIAISPSTSDLRFDLEQTRWLISGFSLAVVSMVPASVFLMRRFSTRLLFICGLSFLVLGLPTAALASSFTLLMVLLIVQAIGCGLMLSICQMILLALFPNSASGTVMGMFGLSVAVSTLIATLITQNLTASMGWKPLFWGLLAIVIAVLLCSMNIMDDVLDTEPVLLDVPSLGLCCAGLAGIQYCILNVEYFGLRNPQIAGTLMLSAMALIAFWARQRNSASPLINFQLLRNRSFLPSIILVGVISMIAAAGFFAVRAYMLQVVGFSTSQVNAILILGLLVFGLANPLGGKLLDIFGPKTVVIGSMSALTLSSLCFGILGVSTSIWYVSVIYFVHCLITGLSIMPTFTWGIVSVKKQYQPGANALMMSLRSIAGTLIPAVSVFVLVGTSPHATAISSQASETPSAMGTSIIFASMILMSLLGLVIAIVSFRTKSTGKQVTS
ncbi:MAG: MFS transporter [Bifidobacterium aquikefiri]|uniref:MFS transporter n=1 Tax=Bifidobacterium aquikefiri TaxID=1653207 RepID=UPI0039E78A02